MKKFWKFVLTLTPGCGMLAINVVVSLIGSVIYGVIIALTSENPMEDALALATNTNFIMTITIAYQIITLIVAALVYKFAFKKKLEAVNKVFTPASFLTVIVGFAAVETFVSGILGLINIYAPKALEDYAELVETMGLGEMNVLTIIASLILAPIAEELVFRGLTLNLARRVSPKFWVANVIQAACFGIVHMNLVQGLYAFTLGLCLGYIYKKFNSLYASMLAHFSFNFFGTIIVSLIYTDSDSTVKIVLTMLVCLALIIAAAFLIEGNAKCKGRTQNFMIESAALSDTLEVLDGPGEAMEASDVNHN